MTQSLRRDALIALGLFVLALALRLAFLAASPMDGLYGQDAYAYFEHAQAIRNTFATGAPLPAFFWPLGYSGLLAAGFAIFGGTAATGQALSLLMGAALAPLAYALARAAHVNRPGALAAGLLVAVNGQAIQSSLVLMADVPALFWASLSALALLLALRGGRIAFYVLAGLILGLAVITRWANLLLLFPFAASVVSRRGSRRGALIGLAAFAVVLLPQLWVSAASPYPSLNHAWVQGWSPMNAFARDFVNVDGVFHYAQANGLFYAAPAFDPYFLAPLAVPLIALGVFALRGPARWLFILWALTGWLFLAGIPYQNVRFGLLLTPPLAVLAGAGFGWVWTALARARLGRAAVAGLVAASLIWMLVASVPRVTDFLNRQQSDKEAVTWAAARIPAGVTVYTSGLTLALRHATSLDVHELYGLAPETLVGEARPGDRVLINRWQIENQWAGTPLQETVRKLEVERGLTPLARFGVYTLYRVAG